CCLLSEIKTHCQEAIPDSFQAYRHKTAFLYGFCREIIRQRLPLSCRFRLGSARHKCPTLQELQLSKYCCSSPSPCAGDFRTGSMQIVYRPWWTLVVTHHSGISPPERFHRLADECVLFRMAHHSTHAGKRKPSRMQEGVPDKRLQ